MISKNFVQAMGVRRLHPPLKALRQTSRKIWPKKIKPYFLTVVARNLTLKIFSNFYVQFQRKLGNKSHNLTYCFISLQSVAVYNFREIESNFSVPF